MFDLTSNVGNDRLTSEMSYEIKETGRLALHYHTCQLWKKKITEILLTTSSDSVWIQSNHKHLNYSQKDEWKIGIYFTLMCFTLQGGYRSKRKKLPDFSLISLSIFLKFPWFSSLIIYGWPNFSEIFWFFSYLSKNTFQNFVCNCATYSTNLTWTF